MKLLIAYDGSQGADAALADLSRAHLPENTQALVLSVADVWLPPESLDGGTTSELGDGRHPTIAAIGTINFAMRTSAKREIAEFDALAFEAAETLRRKFPSWQISSEARADSPAWGVLAVADRWKPDLLLAGATGRNSAVDAWLVGTVSQKLVTKARCSVRIGRESRAPDAPPHLVIGFDGSPDSHAAIAAINARSWPQDTKARLIVALNPRLRTGLAEEAIPALGTHGDAGEALDAVMSGANRAIDALRETGLDATLHVREGEPREVLLDEVRRSNAAELFVGAKGLVGASGLAHLRRFFLGSTATALVWRAPCTVEVARAPSNTGSPGN